MTNEPRLTGRDALADQVAELNRAGGAYHKYTLGDGIVIEGDYDMTKYLRYYNLPPRLDGTSVLDVGTASGFLAVECAQRGAQVTAIDLWGTPAPLQIACDLLGVRVRYLQKDVLDFDASLGQFDLVICGSMLLHVASPLEVLRRIRTLCRGRATISTTCPTDSENNVRPVCDFLGVHANDGDYWHYWTISAAALRKMLLAAGFSTIAHEAHFSLQTEPGRVHYVSPHVVVSADI